MKSKSFCDFGILLLGGDLKLLTFGQYCAKNTGFSDKNKRRRVIKHFYEKLLN
jgi:hypothetical protein